MEDNQLQNEDEFFDAESEEEDTQTTKETHHGYKEQATNVEKQTGTANLSILANRDTFSNDINSLKSISRTVKHRRKEITPRPSYGVNLWSVIKNSIGKDLSKIPVPVNFSEPLSMLQRFNEELEYSNLLDLAANIEDQWEQMAYVATFIVSSYSTTAFRLCKPFNPLLGETYECDRLDDLGWRSITEQVSHHPPGFATNVESIHDWVFYEDLYMTSKFRINYLQVIPAGQSHLEFIKSGHHYTWTKVSTYVRNFIVGKLCIDSVGAMEITNHKTKDVCRLNFLSDAYFTKEPTRKITAVITDSNNIARYVLNGIWTDKIEGSPVLNPQVYTEKTELNTGESKVLWSRRCPP